MTVAERRSYWVLVAVWEWAAKVHFDYDKLETDKSIFSRNRDTNLGKIH